MKYNCSEEDYEGDDNNVDNNTDTNSDSDTGSEIECIDYYEDDGNYCDNYYSVNSFSEQKTSTLFTGISDTSRLSYRRYMLHNFEQPEIKNIDFTVILRNANISNQNTSINFSAIWDTNEYENISSLKKLFLFSYRCAQPIIYENCEYFVDGYIDNLENN